MNESWLFFLMLIVTSVIVHGFYSMLEMASVSFNRVRLQYFVSKKNRRALWLMTLLNHPIRLFGTTLIGVNAAMQFGSECARRFYASIGLSPDWSPLSQVFIVLIFAELAPMFAARRYAERVAMLGIPLVYLTSLVLSPLIYALDLICRVVNRLFGASVAAGLYLSRDELQRAIEGREDLPHQSKKNHYNPILVNLFTLKGKAAKDVMSPLSDFKLVASDDTVSGLRRILGLESVPFALVYHRSPSNIVAVAHLRDLLRLGEETPIRAYSRSPWFITEKNSTLEIIKEFKRNNQSLAVVLDEHGQAVGILTLDDIVDEVFGHRYEWRKRRAALPEAKQVLIDRSFPGDTSLADLNQWLGIHLGDSNEETLEGLMTRRLGHRPERGEVVREQTFELIVEETSLLAGKTILIRSIR
ncbi:MAG: hemolysin family protein [Chlamydiota bacterium]